MKMNQTTSNDWTLKELYKWFRNEYPEFGLRLIPGPQELRFSIGIYLYDDLNRCVASFKTKPDPTLDDIKKSIKGAFKALEEKK